MLDSFHMSSESEVHVALFTPQEQPSAREFQVLEEVPPGGRDLPLAPVKRKRRAWAPNADDHLIYRWVKLDGKGQDYVAQCFGIDQSTVSRIVQRYERWEAHAEARDNGRLDPAERLRSQRWLAFERNEAMLTSCLRLAGEMDGWKDVSKSVTRHPLNHPTQESDVRTEWSAVDRTGMAARFLRLAFRINMEQVKLAEAEPAPLPEPLTEEEVAEQEAHAAEEHAQIVAVRGRGKQETQATQVSIMDQLEAARYEAAQARRDAAAAREEAKEARRQLVLAGATAGLPSSAGNTSGPDTDAKEQADEQSMHKMHNLHPPSDANSDISAEPAGVYATKVTADKKLESCMHTSLVHALDEPSRPAMIPQPTGKEPGEPPRDSP